MAADDQVRIHDLTVDCIIGDLPHEREHAQRIHLDLTLQADCGPAAAADTLAAAVDYVEACALAARVCVEGRFHLVETLADRVATALLATFAPVTAVTVAVRKPAAVPAAAWVGCRVCRERA